MPLHTLPRRRVTPPTYMSSRRYLNFMVMKLPKKCSPRLRMKNFISKMPLWAKNDWKAGTPPRIHVQARVDAVHFKCRLYPSCPFYQSQRACCTHLSLRACQIPSVSRYYPFSRTIFQKLGKLLKRYFSLFRPGVKYCRYFLTTITFKWATFANVMSNRCFFRAGTYGINCHKKKCRRR